MHSKALNFRVPRLGKNKFGVYYLRLTVTAADGKPKVVQKSLLTKDPLTAKVMALRFNLQLMDNAPMSSNSQIRPYFVEAATGRIQSSDDADAARRREAQKRGIEVRAKLHPAQLAALQSSNRLPGVATVDADFEIDLVAGRFYARDETAHRRLMEALDDIELMAMSFVPPELSTGGAATAAQVPAMSAEHKQAIEGFNAIRNAMLSVSSDPQIPIKLLKDAFDEHLESERQDELTEQTIQEKRNVFDDFLDEIGHDCVLTAVTKSVINVRWKSAELKRKNRKDATKTISKNRILKRFSYLRKFFDWAIETDYLPNGTNPCGKAPVKKKKADADKVSYKPYTKDELGRLFSEKFKSFGVKPDWYWIPLIALYSGARVGELAGLELDGFEVREGVKLFTIKVGKNLESRRVVPIHSALLELGLWDYIEYLRAQKAKRLFPSRPKNKNASKSIGRMWGKWVDACEINDDSKVFHSFRSTVITKLHNQIEPVNAVALRDAVGHTKAEVSGSHGNYIIGHELVVVQRTIEQITHPTVDISKLKIADPAFKLFYAKEGTFNPASDEVSPAQLSRLKHEAAKAERLERLKKSRNRNKTAISPKI